MAKIEKLMRLDLHSRNRARINKRDARFLHVVDEEQLFQPTKAARYNVRQADGSIQKYTLFDNKIVIEIVKKVKDKYQKISKDIFKVTE